MSLKKDDIILFVEKKYEESVMFSETLKQSLEAEKKKSRRLAIGVGVGGTLVGILLGVLLR